MNIPPADPCDRLTHEVKRLYPEYARDPEDIRWNKGNGVFLSLGPDGSLRGQVFGDDRAIQHTCHEIAVRKLLQVWRTGYHTGRFEELVFAGKLDEGQFGIAKPTFIGWEGGVPLVTPDGRRLAAAFSGFRGTSDIALIERAAVAAGLGTVPR
jgi:glc operon protein GlcG